MDTWIVCPACRLRHVPRLDRSCPRCGQPVDFSPDPVFVRARRRGATRIEETGLPRGARIAGGFLAGAGVLVLAGRALAPIAGPTARVSVPVAVLDVLVGALLVSRYEKVAGLARARV